ncbi:MAG: hypothetical protein IJK98_11500 [Clostridia bacterium]|nr:hypothetical protein [Clostridia bacterium]
MTDVREDNEIVGAAPEEQYLEPADNENDFVVTMEQQPVFSPDALPADEVPAELAPLLERAFLFLEDGEWAKADEYCERVLDKAPRTSLAYLGKFMAEKRVKTREELPEVPIDAEGDRNYSKAVRFAPPDLAETLTRYALTGRSAKKRQRLRRALAAVLIPLACLLLISGIAAALWFCKLLPEKTWQQEVAALEGAVIGDTVTFGSFLCPTEWQVLEKQGDAVLLLSRRAVGVSRYNDSSVDTTWAKSDVRRWLNGEFYENSFGKREKALIRVTEPDAGADSGDAYGYRYPYAYDDEEDWAGTKLYDDGEGADFLSYTARETPEGTDRLFLLSLSELNRCLKTENEKRCLAPLDKKAAKNAGEEAPAEYIGWWLRTQTREGMPACYIDETGAARYDYYGEDPALGVRPAVWVDLGNRE